MPEGVEVYWTSLWLNHILRSKKILNINILAGRYSRHPLSGIDIFDKYKPFYINFVKSKGKFMFFQLSSVKNNKICYIFSRYGLEGHWGLTKLKHSGIEFHIKDHNTNVNNYVYFTDPRSFGSIEITNNINDLNYELNKLATDCVKDTFSNTQFHNMIYNYLTRGTDNIIESRSDKEIIKILMDQQAIVSSLGNYLSSEILFVAKISPYTKIIDIYNNKKLSNMLAKSIKYVTKLSFLTSNIGYLQKIEKNMFEFINSLRNKIINDQNHTLNIHPDIVIPKNKKFKFNVYRQKKDPYGNTIKKDIIIKGRTTYWSPTIQVN